MSPVNKDPTTSSMRNLNGLTGRASPADRQNASPTVNGIASHPTAKSQSVNNVTADLLRDLKAKDTDLEASKRQISWMKEALNKASKAGYAYVERDVTSSPEITREEVKSELALQFKNFRAEVQVSTNNALPSTFILTLRFIGGNDRASKAGV